MKKGYCMSRLGYDTDKETTSADAAPEKGMVFWVDGVLNALSLWKYE